MGSDAQQVSALAAERLGTLLAGLRSPRWNPLPHQVPPPGDWRGWLLMAGRGAGKTDACAKYMADHVAGPPCIPGPVPHWMGIIAPTHGDAVTSCYAGPSGLRVHSPESRLLTVQGGTVVRWPNGSEAKVFGAHTEDDVERLRSGGNRCLVWLEELAAWRYLDSAWDQMRFGLRTGPRPHWVASTTPKPRSLIKRLANGEIRNIVLSKATMYDNPHLPEDIRQELLDTYEGTQIGRQELLAEIIDQDENALWTHEKIDAARILYADLPNLGRITVGVDPSGGAGEQGIVVSGRAMLPRNETDKRLLAHGFVLADWTVSLPPDGWARRAVQAAVEYGANDIVVERNYGGDMAITTVRTAADAMGVSIPIRKVWAADGKRVRAAPVAALTEQLRWHHAGVFPELEDQMCTWYEDLDWSPDRLDAAVWGAHQNKVVRAWTSVVKNGQSSAMNRAIG